MPEFPRVGAVPLAVPVIALPSFLVPELIVMFWLACRNVCHVPACVNALLSVVPSNAIRERLILSLSFLSVKRILSPL